MLRKTEATLHFRLSYCETTQNHMDFMFHLSLTWEFQASVSGIAAAVGEGLWLSQHSVGMCLRSCTCTTPALVAAYFFAFCTQTPGSVCQHRGAWVLANLSLFAVVATVSCGMSTPTASVEQSSGLDIWIFAADADKCGP